MKYYKIHSDTKYGKGKGKFFPKIEGISRGKLHTNTLKLIQNISTITYVFLDQKRIKIYEHTVKNKNHQERNRKKGEAEGKLSGNYLRLIRGLCLEDGMN